jgi:hypothetical protein
MKLRVRAGCKYEKRRIVNIFQNPKLKQEYGIEINNRFEIQYLKIWMMKIILIII